jgi:mRNA interferase HigB
VLSFGGPGARGQRRLVVMFNIHGNDFRLICAIHYNTAKVFLLRFLSHAEYDKDRWKSEL